MERTVTPNTTSMMNSFFNDENPFPLRIVPLRTFMKYVNGNTLLITCIIFGMASLGNIYPESNIFGIIINIDNCIACSWLLDIVDMSSPIPNALNKNITEKNNNNAMLPATGTLNQKILNINARIISMNPIITYGIILPTINSIFEIGVTISCSMVPFSLSLTIEKEVSIKVTVCNITPIRPGTLKLMLLISALYHTLLLKSKGCDIVILGEELSMIFTDMDWTTDPALESIV